MKQYPPHLSHQDARSVALLPLTVLFLISMLLIVGGARGLDSRDWPLEAPVGLDL